MSERMIDPFKLVGPSSNWGAFGTGERDMEADAERRAMGDHIKRRLARSLKRNTAVEDAISDVLAGGLVAQAQLFVGVSEDSEKSADDLFEIWVNLASFAWMQASTTIPEGRA